MKHLKKILCCTIMIAMTIAMLSSVTGKLKATEECKECNLVEPIVVDTRYEDGNLVKTFDDGVEVTFLEDEFIIKDFNHIYDDYYNLNPNQRIGWVLLGKVLFTIYNAVSACSVIPYVSGGHDLCRIALSYLGTSKKPNVYYDVKGQYVPGKIPGCEPSYSGPCNAGYWQYSVSRS